MFERFTDRARRSVVLAQEQARALNHNFIGTEHLLLGLLDEAEGVAGQSLALLGVTMDDALAWVKRNVGEGQTEPRGHLPFTPNAKQTLEQGLRESTQLGVAYIGTEHLLLGLLRHQESKCTELLADLGVGIEAGRRQVIAKLCGYGLISAPTEDQDDPEQPVGEIPDIYPSVARAYKSVDDVAAELRGVKAANAELQRENVALAAKLDDARAEVDNVTTLLKASGHHVAALSDNLCSYQAERDELRDMLEEREDQTALIEDLQSDLAGLDQSLSAEIADLQKFGRQLAAERDAALAERDTAKAEASVQR